MKYALIGFFTLSCLGTMALAGDTGSSAGVGPGRSNAAAWHRGQHGYAQTTTRSGWVDYARATAVDWGPGGLDVSTSYAVRSPGAGSVAGGLHIGSGPGGGFVGGSQVVSQGPYSSAGAGGRILGHRAGAAQAFGHSGPYGNVKAHTFSRSIDYGRHLRVPPPCCHGPR